MSFQTRLRNTTVAYSSTKSGAQSFSLWQEQINKYVIWLKNNLEQIHVKWWGGISSWRRRDLAIRCIIIRLLAFF